jgi:hypothetical protein
VGGEWVEAKLWRPSSPACWYRWLRCAPWRREAIERHMDPERLKVMRLAEEQEREVLRNIWGGVA